MLAPSLNCVAASPSVSKLPWTPTRLTARVAESKGRRYPAGLAEFLRPWVKPISAPRAASKARSKALTGICSLQSICGLHICQNCASFHSFFVNLDMFVTRITANVKSCTDYFVWRPSLGKSVRRVRRLCFSDSAAQLSGPRPVDGKRLALAVQRHSVHLARIFGRDPPLHHVVPDSGRVPV